MKVQRYQNPMRENVYDVPGLLIDQCVAIEKNSRMILSVPEIYGLKRIVITGCGDSYAAGLSMKGALEYLTGLPVEILPAMQMARYECRDAFGKPESVLVIAVSNSGKVSRVAEAVERAGRFGALTLALTGDTRSKLADAAKRNVLLEIPEFAAGSGNGVRSYLVSMLSLLLVGIRIGEVKLRYTMDSSQRYRDEMRRYAEEFEKYLEGIDLQVLMSAERNIGQCSFEFLGSGGNYGTAWFSHAKIVEATGDFASFNDAESWMHVDCFSREIDKRCLILFSNAGGPDRSRVEEVLDVVGQMKGSIMAVTDDPGLKVPEKTERIILPRPWAEWMNPLLNYLPAALLAGYLSVMKGETYGRNGQEDWEAVSDIRLITESRIEHIGEERERWEMYK